MANTDIDNLFEFNNLKPLTLKARIGFYKSLGINGVNDIYKLNDTDKILSRVYDTDVNYTRSTRLYYIKKLIERYPHKVKDGISKFYSDLSSSTKFKLVKQLLNNKQSDKDKERMLSYKHMVSLLKTRIPLIRSHADLTKVEFALLLNRLQDYIIIKIYLENPVRNNLAHLELIDNVKKAVDKKTNYVVINKNQVMIILNNFKNSDTFGRSVVQFTNMLDIKIRSFIRLKNIFDIKFFKKSKLKHTLFYHISSKKLEPLSSESMVHKIKDISNVFFGVPVSINDYRKIWETRLMKSQRYLKMTNEERDLEHRKIQHGTTVAIDNYNKV